MRSLQRALLACACALVLGSCGGGGDEGTATTSTASTPAGEVSRLRERLNRLVTRLLVDRGLDPSVTDCALIELARRLPDPELQAAVRQIRNTGAPPPGLIEAATAAGQACGQQ